jgi:hypothetical protein
MNVVRHATYPVALAPCVASDRGKVRVER